MTVKRRSLWKHSLQELQKLIYCVTSQTFCIRWVKSKLGYPFPLLWCQIHCTAPPTSPYPKPNPFPTTLVFIPWGASSKKVTTCSYLIPLLANIVPLPPHPTPGSFPCKRSHCQTCPIHPSSLFFTSPVINLTYLIHTLATCSSSNLIYLLICTHCDAFYVRETKNSLSTTMNGHQSFNNLPLLVAVYTKSYLITFNSCWNVCVFHYLPPNTNHITYHHLELVYQFILSSRRSPGIFVPLIWWSLNFSSKSFSLLFLRLCYTIY